MKSPLALILPCILCLPWFVSAAELAPALGKRGKLLLEEKFDGTALPKGWNMNRNRKPVQVEIGQDVVVHGDLIFEHAVELKLHETARVGKIIGEYVQD